MMRDQPNRFPEKVIKALQRHAEDSGEYEPEELQRERRLASPMTERATLEVVLEVRQQFAKLSEQVQGLRNNPPKRGFFG